MPYVFSPACRRLFLLAWLVTFASVVPRAVSYGEQPVETSNPTTGIDSLDGDPSSSADDLASPQQRRGRGFGQQGLYKARIEPNWFADNSRFWYRNSLRGGNKEFVLVDAESGTRRAAFDHAKLAESLSAATEEKYEAEKLPFNRIEFTDGNQALRLVVDGTQWECNLDTYDCKKLGEAPAEPEEPSDEGRFRSGRRRFGRGPGEGRRSGRGGTSPDGKWEALVRDGNVFIRATDKIANTDAENKAEENEGEDKQANDAPDEDKPADSVKAGDEFQLSDDGTEKVSYGMLQWAPDSKTLVAFRVEPGDRKEVYLVESSPSGGGRAVMRSRSYDLPGDKLTSFELNLFDIAEKKQSKPKVDKIDLDSPRIWWDRDGQHFAYQKVDRGHQRFRIIRVDSHTGDTNEIIDEKTDTFIWTAHAENVDLEMVNWLPDSDEIIYVSERDGWRHMYLIDAEKGEIKNQITKGEYVVRGIDRIDEEKRQIWFHASGKNPDQDPYFLHYYRVNFDGTDLTALTDSNGNHTAQFSPDRKYLIDTFSRVDMPPKHELRRASDGKLVCALEEADASELMARSDYHPLEVFVSKGRDGKTDIWGVICRPRDFDPAKKYPVIESIYAGPQGSFVPKSFGGGRYSSLADLGFVVVQIDGMGTANRSKAFHDVCWHNIKDAGFPDRILWMKAAAEKYPYMDLSRVGIYGGSAGGQNAAAGVLFHPEFYKAAVAGCGCHDNRMDKASWNEQWMGYPVGPQYSECSNIDNASRLQGKLMLIVGELDDNVPVESTFRFADALIKARKDFDLIVVPGAGHGMGGEYGVRRQQDFFVRHLLGTELPDRNLPDSGKIAGDRPTAGKPDDEADGTLNLAALSPTTSVTKIVDRFRADRANLRRYYTTEQSPKATSRWKSFYAEWLEALRALPTNSSDDVGRAQLAELKREVVESLSRIEQQSQRRARIEPLIPFATTIEQLVEDRRQVNKVNAEEAAALVDNLSRKIRTTSDEVEISLKDSSSNKSHLSPENLEYAAETIAELRTGLRDWYRFYDGYDPQFTWWLRAPYKQADEALDKYAAILGGAHEETVTAASPPSPNPSNGDAKTDSTREQPVGDAPDLKTFIDEPPSRMEPIIAKFRAEFPGQRGRWGNQDRFRDPDRPNNNDEAEESDRRRGGDASGAGRRQPESPAQREKAKAQYAKWLSALDKLDFDRLSAADRVDYLLLTNHINYLLRKPESPLDTDDRRDLPTSADRPIKGHPIGRDGLLVELQHEMIPYAPEQLLKIAERENAWCEAELTKAAQEMGLGDDWRKAVEKVKRMHVPPGQQPYLIHDLALEAIEYLKENDLVTVPPLAAETWGLRMMSPRRQLINPFFTGGNEISVSFPTDTMSHEEKLQSMRGNNIPFARATVHHELIPGHNLQFYMTARHHTYRRMFSTPFWGEGWALYWEMLLYDRGFPKTPEDRVGFLTWRKHRCARIIFSLSFHLGRMSPEECIDFLVANVGFDRHNAAAEVRRSFEGAEPLYQAAYMLGGLQIRELRKELVDSGKMTNREFHDAILKENSIPIVMVRALLTNEKLAKDFKPNWQFYGPISADEQVAGASP